MKTSRRNFFGKLGLAIAAMATGFGAAKAVSKEEYCRSKTIKAISDCCQPRELPFGYEAKILFEDTGKGPGGMVFQELSGDYKNLRFNAAFSAGLLAASKHAHGNETVIFTGDAMSPFIIEKPLNPS